MAGPWLVGRRDRLVAARRALRGDYRRSIVVTLALAVAALLSGWLRSVFVLRSRRDRPGRSCSTCAAAASTTPRRCRSSFHERFTSGRVISRLTSDVDTLTELLDAGLDGLITAVLQHRGDRGAAVRARRAARADRARLADPAVVAVPLVLRRARPIAFRRTRETVATLIVNIVETFNGIRAVQAFRRETRNDAIFAGLNDDYREANRRGVPAARGVHPGHHADRQRRRRSRVLLVGGYRVADGGLELGVLTAFLLYLRQFYDPMEDVAIFYNSLQSATAALEKIAGGAGRASRRARARAPLTSLPTPVGGALDFDRVRVRLPRRPAGAATSCRCRHPGRADRRAGRRDRCRQDDDRQADLALLRPDQRRRAPGRRRPARHRRDADLRARRASW